MRDNDAVILAWSDPSQEWITLNQSNGKDDTLETLEGGLRARAESSWEWGRLVASEQRQSHV